MAHAVEAIKKTQKNTKQEAWPLCQEAVLTYA